MTVIRHSETRRTETPGGIMTTLASPTQGGASLPLWRVELAPGQSGPLHFIDAEQVWTVLSGSAEVTVDGADHVIAAGDTIILPPDVLRQISGGAEGFTAIVTAPAGARAGAPDRDGTIVPPWIA
ncbi:cupin domain-containing protein [Nocardia cyriacigeorgica]|uniref:cupin domain-containing protein n=1 Tax=Nocardia cyriacigeorgica TaxID=135487 RepID=UPI001895399D|nr:cupin domain-containing protein [Nocardia cyriacigeorgica]MBF6455364.1 cupin domain-containing protein [Nocardia cyriacigeorgica]MBF6479053.1 cupin domain-containing protein [Nocardia cyriacigeorgica]MBF6553894.1 cupin domain-containing protein [Nocardia cyriacigeorgica]